MRPGAGKVKLPSRGAKPLQAMANVRYLKAFEADPGRLYNLQEQDRAILSRLCHAVSTPLWTLKASSRNVASHATANPECWCRSWPFKSSAGLAGLPRI